MKSAASILALATSALAATIEVQVSSVFTPDSITAADGDIIQFNFQSQHSVARSDFSSPCVGATDNASCLTIENLLTERVKHNLNYRRSTTLYIHGVW